MQLKDIYFRFSKPRKHQDQLMLDIGNAIEQGNHIICHAELGLGKTDAALSPAITYALKEGKTVFFLTPKISQHEIAVEAVRGLAEKFKLNLKAVDLVGRKYMCVDPLLNSADFDGFYEICSRRRRKEQCIYYANAVGFTKKQKSVARLYMEKLKKSYGVVWHHNELKGFCEHMQGAKGERPMCAYEASVRLAKECNVIIADYFHVLSPSIQDVILSKLNVKLEDCILIVDEAHNLPDRIRKLMSTSLSTITLKRAIEEAKKLGQEDLLKNLKNIERIIKALGKHSLTVDVREALISKQRFLEPLLVEIGSIEEFSSLLKEQAVEYMEATNKGRSFLFNVANFLEKWERDLEAHIRIIKRMQNDADFSIMYKALDAALVTKGIFSKTHSTVLMSGTLMPTKMYADLLGFEENRTIMKEYESPFPKENRLNLIVPTVTTKYTERKAEEYKKIAVLVAGIVNNVPGNSAVFFPSFKILESVAMFLQELVPREIIKQKERMTSTERTNQIKRFRNAGSGFGAVLLAVASGSYAEGLDYPGSQLLCAIIVGIPLQEMNLETKCLIDYFEEKYARGWHYGYLYPAISRAIQASGRVIRDSGDEGIIAFLDKRYLWQNYRNCFPKSFNALSTKEPEKYVKVFWGD